MSRKPLTKHEIQDVLEHKKRDLIFPNHRVKETWIQKAKSIPFYHLEEIQAEANRLIQVPIEELSYSLFQQFQKTGERLGYERIYFEKRRRLNTFAIMLLVNPEEKMYQDALQDIIWSICNEYTWCLPAHEQPKQWKKFSIDQPEFADRNIDLFAAETAFTFAEISQLLQDQLDPLICQRIHEEVYQRVFWPFQQQFHWETATHNWASVCAGSIGAAAIHLIEDQYELATILERVLAAMECYLAGFNEDGACLEGYGYWVYGFGYFVYFADLLLKRTNGKINLFQLEKVAEIALFQQRIFLHDTRVANFSDAVPTNKIFVGLSHYLSKIFSDFQVPEVNLRASYQEDHCSRWAPAFRNLLWMDEQMEGERWKTNTHYFSQANWLISRLNAEENSFSFATKGGHNDEPHNHNDIGHFLLQTNHDSFLIDLGSGMYTKSYFGQKRYTFVCTGSQGHSVPIIDGCFQKAGREQKATVKTVQIEDDTDMIEMEIAQAYDLPQLEKLSRTFLWKKTKEPTLSLIDSYYFKYQPTSIVERFIVSMRSISEDENGVVLHGKRLLRIDYNRNQLTFTKRKMDFLNHFGETESFLALDFSVNQPSLQMTIPFTFRFL